jgi:hypothetical protein
MGAAKMSHPNQDASAVLRDGDSVLAPILIGYVPPEGPSAESLVFGTATDSIPGMTIVRKRLVGRKAVPTDHVRKVFSIGGPEGSPYGTIARCCDVAPGEEVSSSVARWEWETGLYAMKEGSYPDLIPPSHRVRRLDVTRFRLTNGGVVAAAQLALFRYLLVQGFLALDPAAIVVGGQRSWRGDWWPDPASANGSKSGD